MVAVSHKGSSPSRFPCPEHFATMTAQPEAGRVQQHSPFRLETPSPSPCTRKKRRQKESGHIRHNDRTDNRIFLQHENGRGGLSDRLSLNNTTVLIRINMGLLKARKKAWPSLVSGDSVTSRAPLNQGDQGKVRSLGHSSPHNGFGCESLVVRSLPRAEPRLTCSL